MPQQVQFNIRLLTEEVLQIIPLDKGEIDLALKYSEKTGGVSLELLMPAGIVSILKDKNFSPDDLSMTIVRGLCDHIHEVVDNTPVGPRVRVCFEMKKMDEE